MIRRKPNMAPCKTPMAALPVEERLDTFDEVYLGYTLEEAKQEAERCLNCPDRYCARHCPAHNYIPEFIAAIREDDLLGAWELLARTNPLMEIAGRVCPYERQCESHCTRGIKCQPVAIGRLERFVADWRRNNMPLTPKSVSPNGKSAAVVGAGPAGMTCAHSLCNAGFRVTVYEQSDHVGGVVSWGIPSFVLPTNLMQRLKDLLADQGVVFRFNTALGRDITLEELRQDYDAVFVATGAPSPVELVLPGRDLPQVVQAKDYLTCPDDYAGSTVLVIGGGNTAIDVARTAVRKGASSVQLVYRRTEADMPATLEELALAREEGIGLISQTAPAQFLSENGRLTGLLCDVMRLTAPDYPGGRNNVAPSGEKVTLPCELAVLALGFENLPVDGLRVDERNRLVTGRDFSTSMEKVYAGGDAVTGAATLMKAVAAGKDAAAAIFEQLVVDD